MNPFSFANTADLVVLTIRDHALQVLLVERGIEPFAGRWALPGGFVLPDEGIEQAAYRELREETGVTEGVHLEQLRSYGDPDRDPRGRVVTIAWLAMAPDLGEAVSGSDARSARWWSIAELEEGDVHLAFDHTLILADGVERARAKLEYSALATAFCPPEFTIAQLRAVYETVWGVPVDPRNFHRKVTGAEGFIEATGGLVRDGGRPAQLYRRGPVGMLQPPFTRPDPHA
ncbi:MAG: NUDIX hydrolase [Microbacterium sp. 69-10]|uniref:NUDIX hydrolase n=1 Tax=Microbacterium sp. 69-10 TaxID=1895783 RepID=UPI00095E01C6|nr:NUDIX domain-containing protein [Microbacterium sp. 69-10]OJU42461.1 MAG: NUDIX hydrolase [Microbacterium sp. 69-10]